MKNRSQVVSIAAVTLLFLLGCSLLPGRVTSKEEQIIESPAPDKFTLVRLDYGDASLNQLLIAEIQKAREQGRRPYVEFYADWCGPCNSLRENLGDERMVDAFAGTYIIQLDIDEWKGELSGTGFSVPGIPIFFEVNEKGEPTGRIITGGAWGEDIPENMAPPLKEFFHSNANTDDTLG